MTDKAYSTRRRLLVRTTATVGTVGLLSGLYPLIASMSPSAKAQGEGAPVEVDISRLDSVQQITVVWRKKPVWVLRRSIQMLEAIAQTNPELLDPASRNTQQQPAYAQNNYRSIEPEVLIVVALCTHLGCIPTFRPNVAPPDLGIDWQGGYFCPCHGSKFDLAGRVYKNVPAPSNLVVPPYAYLSESVIEIGGAQAQQNT